MTVTGLDRLMGYVRSHRTMLALITLLLASSAAHAQSWTCSARDMITGTYDGGATAYIHLSPYGRGNHYPVTKKGKTVTGRTSNGTPFVCKQQ